METLRQVLTVPKNHQLHLDVTLPQDFPEGPTEILLVFSPKTAPANLKNNVGELLELAGSLKKSPHFGGDPLKIQKALRDEWRR